MKKILFLKSFKANLPEIEAYRKFFSTKGILSDVVDTLEQVDWEPYQWLWLFMGTDRYDVPANIQVIHDYRSLSTGRFPRIKDRIKKAINRKPAVRIFLNAFVKQCFGFKDQVPEYQIDMGVDPIFNQKPETELKYKLGYIGEISASRNIDIFLKQWLASRMNQSTLLLVGRYDPEIYNTYSKYPQITFTGKVPYAQIPEYIHQIEYALNIIPTEYPFTYQTSTKLLEYMVCGKKIISTPTKYSQTIMKQTGSQFLMVKEWSHLTEEILQQTPFVTKAPDYVMWDEILAASGIEAFFQNSSQS